MVAMGVPFLVLAVLVLSNKDRLSRIFDAKLLERLSANSDALHPKVRSTLLFLAIFLMLVALGRPVKELGETRVKMEGLSLLVGLDISASMRSEDQYPSRLEFAKKKIEALLDVMPSDEIGIAAFAQRAFVIAPFTTNKETLKQMIGGINSGYINHGATNFEAMGELAGKLLEKKEPKIVVLVSDGGDQDALKGLEEMLQQHHIKLYTILLGTEKGAPVLDAEGKPLSLEDGTIAITQRHDALLSLSSKVGGRGFVASTGKEDIEELVAHLKGSYSNQEYGEVVIKQQKEYFYYPLALGVISLLLGFSSFPQRRKV
jgi:Ca-activated chloride channel family protein